MRDEIHFVAAAFLLHELDLPLQQDRGEIVVVAPVVREGEKVHIARVAVGRERVDEVVVGVQDRIHHPGAVFVPRSKNARDNDHRIALDRIEAERACRGRSRTEACAGSWRVCGGEVIGMRAEAHGGGICVLLAVGEVAVVERGRGACIDAHRVIGAVDIGADVGGLVAIGVCVHDLEHKRRGGSDAAVGLDAIGRRARACCVAAFAREAQGGCEVCRDRPAAWRVPRISVANARSGWGVAAVANVVGVRIAAPFSRRVEGAPVVATAGCDRLVERNATCAVVAGKEDAV